MLMNQESEHLSDLFKSPLCVASSENGKKIGACVQGFLKLSLSKRVDFLARKTFISVLTFTGWL